MTGEPDGAQALIEGMRELHPDVPIVLVASGMEPAWMETAGLHGVTPLVGRPTGERLAEAIEAAHRGQGRPRRTGLIDFPFARARRAGRQRNGASRRGWRTRRATAAAAGATPARRPSASDDRSHDHPAGPAAACRPAAAPRPDHGRAPRRPAGARVAQGAARRGRRLRRLADRPHPRPVPAARRARRPGRRGARRGRLPGRACPTRSSTSSWRRSASQRAAFDEDVLRVRRLVPRPIRRVVHRIPAALQLGARAAREAELGTRVRGLFDKEGSPA